VDLKAIRKALENAFIVASIAPKPKPLQRQRRASISEDMGLKDALRAYVENHPELKDIENELQAYSADLESELSAGGAA